MLSQTDLRLDEAPHAPGIQCLLLDLVYDALPDGKPKLAFMLRRKGLSTAAIAKRLRIKEESVRLYEWRALSAARKLAEQDGVLRTFFEACRE